MIQRSLPLILWAFWACSVSSAASAQQVPMVEYPVFSTVEPGVQSGLYALLAAAQALDRQLPLEELIDGRWFTLQQGQTAADIARTARHFGFDAYPVRRLTLETLYLAHCPIILLLDDLRGRDESYHWVTFLGWEGRKVVIYDSLFGIRTLSPAELMSRWSGRGVVISHASQGVSPMVFWQIVHAIRLYLPAALFVLVCGVLLRMRKRSLKFPHRWQRLAIGFSFVVAWILFDAWISPISLLTSPALRECLRCHEARIDASLQQQESVTCDAIGESAVVVDSRLPIAYAMGHLPGAINVPVNSNCFQIKEAMKSISTDSKVVVYCQNSRCDWAARMAGKLQCLGYRACILRDGVEGWIEQGRPMER